MRTHSQLSYAVGKLKVLQSYFPWQSRKRFCTFRTGDHIHLVEKKGNGITTVENYPSGCYSSMVRSFNVFNQVTIENKVSFIDCVLHALICHSSRYSFSNLEENWESFNTMLYDITQPLLQVKFHTITIMVDLPRRGGGGVSGV